MNKFINILKQLLMHYESILVRIIQFALGFIIIIRVMKAIINAFFIDFNCYIKTARLISKGISPYNQEICANYHIPLALQPPSMSLLTIPWLNIPDKHLPIIYIIASMTIYFFFVIMVFDYYGFGLNKHLSPKWHNLPVLISMTMVCISFPFFMMLKNGQNSAFVAFCLFLVLFFPQKDNRGNFILLAISAAMKYSLMLFSVPVLLLQRRIKMGIAAFLLFAILVLSVGLWLEGIVPAFLDYVQLVISSSHNSLSYANVQDASFLHIGFIKILWINTLLKISILVIYTILIMKIYKQQTVQSSKTVFPMQLTAVEWGLITSFTLIISYHRIYDGILFMPFLGVALLESLKRIQFMHTISKTGLCKAICLLFILLFWTMPQKYINVILSKIGTLLPFGEKVFYYSSTRIDAGKMAYHIIPGIGIMMLIMIAVFLWIEFSHDCISDSNNSNMK